MCDISFVIISIFLLLWSRLASTNAAREVCVQNETGGDRTSSRGLESRLFKSGRGVGPFYAPVRAGRATVRVQKNAE